MKKKHSALSIFALNFTFVSFGTIGPILAIIDLIFGKKERKHILSIISVSISGFILAFFMGIIAIGMALDTPDENNEHEKVTISNEIIDTETESETEKPTEKITEKVTEKPTEKVTEKPTEKVTEKPTEKVTEKPTEKVTEKPTENPNKFEADGLYITVNKVNLNFTDYEDDFGLYELDNDKKYITASFTFENKSNEDKYISISDFDCYADGTLCEQDYLILDQDVSFGDLSPNRNLSFDVCFVVPKEAKSIELEYEVDLWTGEKLIIKLK